MSDEERPSLNGTAASEESSAQVFVGWRGGFASGLVGIAGGGKRARGAGGHAIDKEMRANMLKESLGTYCPHRWVQCQ